MNNDMYSRPTATADTSNEIRALSKKLIDQLDGNTNPEKAVILVRQWLNDNSYDKSYSPPKPYATAKKLLESRTLKASKLINSPVASCGSMVTLGTSILRQMGFKVKLIHGKHPRSHHHAWISIFDKSKGAWKEYDFTGYGTGPAGEIDSDYTKEAECEDWDDIIDLIKKEHEVYLADYK